MKPDAGPSPPPCPALRYIYSLNPIVQFIQDFLQCPQKITLYLPSRKKLKNYAYLLWHSLSRYQAGRGCVRLSNTGKQEQHIIHSPENTVLILLKTLEEPVVPLPIGRTRPVFLYQGPPDRFSFEKTDPHSPERGTVLLFGQRQQLPPAEQEAKLKLEQARQELSGILGQRGLCYLWKGWDDETIRYCGLRQHPSSGFLRHWDFSFIQEYLELSTAQDGTVPGSFQRKSPEFPPL